MKMSEKQQKLAKFLDQSTLAGGADFHLHSNFSDGLESPSEVLTRAWHSGLRAMALTDHDTLGGISEALEMQESLTRENSELKETPVFVAGIEVSTRFADTEMHILAFFSEKPPESMYKFIKQMQLERRLRNKKMVRKVQELGFDLSISGPPESEQDEEVWGRVHLARQLVRDGHFKSSNEAFKKLLSPGQAAYVPRQHFTAKETLETINAANGVAVLAHPHEYKICPESLEDEDGINLLTSVFKELKALGLHGVEAFHGMVGADHAFLFYRLARELNLIVTQGSDDHGMADSSHVNMFTRETNLYRDFVLSRAGSEE